MAFLTGLLTSTFSTFFILFSAHRIGRGVTLSFMEIGTVLLGHAGVLMEPTAREIVVGIVVHQCADVAWAVAFFGLGARLTWQLRPGELLAIAPFWALATQAAEYHVILPWLQPLLRMQTPFWVGCMVHAASAIAYPLFYWIRRCFVADGAAPYARFDRWMAAGLACVLAFLIGTEACYSFGRMPYISLWAGERNRAFDQAFLRWMHAHHAVGVTLAELAAAQATREDLRTLGRLMVAEQQAEIVAQQQWWRNWFGGELPPPTPEEHAVMPGMPSHDTLAQLRKLDGRAFEESFLEVMTSHHDGAIRMANDAWAHAGDPRLRLFADQIRHTQAIQAEHMRQWRYALGGHFRTSR